MTQQREHFALGAEVAHATRSGTIGHFDVKPI
jgi:hypothetical protein